MTHERNSPWIEGRGSGKEGQVGGRTVNRGCVKKRQCERKHTQRKGGGRVDSEGRAHGGKDTLKGRPVKERACDVTGTLELEPTERV